MMPIEFYYGFDYVLITKDYKDALTLRQEAQEKATIKIPVITITKNFVSIGDKHNF